MKFIHIADVHIGGWRNPKLSSLSLEALKEVVHFALNEQVDFLLIAGDLFNTALPGIDHIKQATKELMKLKEQNIPVYAIPGSHDFSPSGKTMLDVLETAQVITNVYKPVALSKGEFALPFVEDKKTGVKLTGILGKRNSLEKSLYQNLQKKNLEEESGKKVFLFHTALEELSTPKERGLHSTSISLLPKGFDYYAGGHVHIRNQKVLDGYGPIIYPGPLFPNSFSELEELKSGSFVLYDNGTITSHAVVIKEVLSHKITLTGKSSEEIELLFSDLSSASTTYQDKILLLRIEGTLPGEILAELALDDLMVQIQQKGAYVVLKNTTKLISEEITKPEKKYSSSHYEEEIIAEHVKAYHEQQKQESEQTADPSSSSQQLLYSTDFIDKLSHIVTDEKQEGETNSLFQQRLLDNLAPLLSEIKKGNSTTQEAFEESD